MVLLRFVIIPFLLASYVDNRPTVATLLLLLASLTDLLDGWLCHRCNVITSGSLERYLDSLADFALVISMFSAFVMKSLYPSWVPPLITMAFLQFILTSGFNHPIYDPVGKYLGVFFFGTIGATILVPRYCGELLYCVIGFLTLSLVSRAYFFTRRRVFLP